MPCILDGIKDFINCDDRKKPLVIIDAILSVLLCAIAIIMLIFIFSNEDFVVKFLYVADGAMCLSSIGFVRYGFITGFLIYDVVKVKKELKED